MMLDAATKLLDDFRKLPDRVDRPQTFMEIAGYPHYENACSNIFAFFMDPEESHGLGTLVLDALLFSEYGTEANKVVGGNITVEREVVTNKGNKIDLIITSDDRAILIENKIHAAVNNPLDDYSDYLDHIADGRAKHKFLLTLYPTSEGSEWDFKNLTHEALVERIRSMLGRYVSNADTRYLTMFLDFLNTLENLRKGTRMNKEFVKLLSEREDDAKGFLAEFMEFRNELRKKVRDLGILIDLEEHQCVNQFFHRETTSLSDDLVHNIRISKDLLVSIDTYVGPQGWDIYIWPRRGGSSDLRDLLQRSMVTFDDEGDKGVSHPAHFDYDEDLDRISPVLQEIINKLATYREPA